jgi:hypothetical protein
MLRFRGAKFLRGEEYPSGSKYQHYMVRSGVRPRYTAAAAMVVGSRQDSLSSGITVEHGVSAWTVLIPHGKKIIRMLRLMQLSWWKWGIVCLRCKGRPSQNFQGWCWLDVNDVKRYKLLAVHPRELVVYCEAPSSGQLLRSSIRPLAPRASLGLR